MSNLHEFAGVSADNAFQALMKETALPISVTGELHIVTGDKIISYETQTDQEEAEPSEPMEEDDELVGPDEPRVFLGVDLPDEDMGLITLAGVDVEAASDVLTRHMSALAAAAYLLGRLDQVNDLMGTNHRRMVRAGEIPSVIRSSMMNDHWTPQQRQYFQEVFSTLRNRGQDIPDLDLDI